MVRRLTWFVLLCQQAVCMTTTPTTATVSSQPPASTTTSVAQPTKQSTPSPKPQPTASQTSPQTSATQVDRHAPSSNDFLRHQPPPPAAFRPPPEFHPNFFTNGNSLFRPGFPSGYQHPAHHHPPVLSHSPLAPSSVQNGKLCRYRFFLLL